MHDTTKSNIKPSTLEISSQGVLAEDALCYDTAGKEPDDLSGSLISDQEEAASILERISDLERAFLMKMLRGAA